MSSIHPCPIPPASFLEGLANDGTYADCYVTSIARPVSQAQFVEAFYTTPLFKLERFILRLASMPSSDDGAGKLASGERDSFAAWHVEKRSPAELLLAAGRTRSWLMAERDGPGTRMFFGSAVLPRRKVRDGEDPMGWGFRALLGFHRLYSKALLRAARSRLEMPGP